MKLEGRIGDLISDTIVGSSTLIALTTDGTIELYVRVARESVVKCYTFAIERVGSI